MENKTCLAVRKATRVGGSGSNGQAVVAAALEGGQQHCGAQDHVTPPRAPQ